VAAKIYARQKYEKVKEKLEKGDVEGGLEGDLAYIIGMIRTKVDSRAPILQKWAEDIFGGSTYSATPRPRFCQTS